MQECKKCGGSGIVGAGENPAAHQGALSTCSECNGTGQVASVAPAPEEVVPESQPAPEESPKAEEDPSAISSDDSASDAPAANDAAPVDNPPAAESAEGVS